MWHAGYDDEELRMLAPVGMSGTSMVSGLMSDLVMECSQPPEISSIQGNKRTLCPQL